MTDADIDAFLASDNKPSTDTSGGITDADIDTFLKGPTRPQLVGKNAGPQARRAASGMAPGEKQLTDEQAGVEGGPLVNTAPTVAGRVASPGEVYPINERDARQADAKALYGKAVAGGLALGVAGPLAAAGEGAAAAAGAGPAIASMAGGAAAGAGATAVTGGSPAEIAAGAGVGAGLSGLMSFVAKRAAETLARKGFVGFARKGSEEAQIKLMDAGQQRVAEVLKKYEIGTIDKPQVAREALDYGIKRAEETIQTAKETIRRSGDNTELANKAARELKQATKDLDILKTLKPIADKVAVNQRFALTAREKLAANPIAAAKEAGVAIAKAPIHAVTLPFRAADKILSELLIAKRNGSLTPDMLTAAISAGVSPSIVQRLSH